MVIPAIGLDPVFIPLMPVIGAPPCVEVCGIGIVIVAWDVPELIGGIACAPLFGIGMVESDCPCGCAVMGIDMRPPGMGIFMSFSAPFAWRAEGFVAVAFLGAGFLAAAFFAACLFFGACFLGCAFLPAIGILMPGMFICAAAGADKLISASVLVAAIKMLFTIPTPIESADAERRLPEMLQFKWLISG